MFKFLDKLNPFKKKDVKIPTITISGIVDNNIQRFLSSRLQFNIEEVDFVVQNAVQNLEISTFNTSELAYRLQFNTEEWTNQNPVYSFINRSTFFRFNRNVNREDICIDGIPIEMINYTNKDHSKWRGVLEQIRELQSEEQNNFQCPITQDLISAPPLLVIGRVGTPIHIFDGRALLESIKHMGLVNPLTRENISLNQIKYGDVAIDYIKAMLAEYTLIDSSYACREAILN